MADSTNAPNTRTATTPKRPVLLALIFAAAGLGLAVLAWSLIAGSRDLAAKGVRTEAQVVAVDEHGRRGSFSYTPTFMFRTADGRLVRHRSTESTSSKEELGGGRRVSVIYDPADPSKVRLASSVAAGPGVLPWIFAGLAVVAFGLAGVAAFRRGAATP